MHEGVTKELKSLQAIHKSLKTENNELKLKHTALQGELLECQNETSSLDVEVSKLTNCCEVCCLLDVVGIKLKINSCACFSFSMIFLQ